MRDSGKMMLFPENFLYVCEKYGILGKCFGMSGNTLVCVRKLRYITKKFLICPGKIFW